MAASSPHLREWVRAGVPDNAQGYVMPKQNEVEIKLRLDPEKIRNFANSEGLAGVQPLKKHYRTTYFDDNKHHLFKSGFELRVRHDGRDSIQTLKTATFVDRGEWEREAADGEPSLEGIEAAGLAKLRRRGITLRRMFSLEVDRTWSLRRGGACIELALRENGGRRTRAANPRSRTRT